MYFANDGVEAKIVLYGRKILEFKNMNSLTWYELSNQLTGRIIQAARSVHHWMGPQHLLADYRSAVANELYRQRLDVQQHFPVDIWQSGELVNLFFLDLFVECQVIVTIKTTRRPLTDEDREDMADCLQACNLPMGILINFGRRGLEYERILPRRFPV